MEKNSSSWLEVSGKKFLLHHKENGPKISLWGGETATLDFSAEVEKKDGTMREIGKATNLTDLQQFCRAVAERSK